MSDMIEVEEIVSRGLTISRSGSSLWEGEEYVGRLAAGTRLGGPERGSPLRQEDGSLLVSDRTVRVLYEPDAEYEIPVKGKEA